ncbi:M64 family metallopeptidase [Streptomyces capillispiralis]|uniref:IgA peptidase M64 n=1 Tax=Streptomyces capillispiralis TaxID=68182 RepID=A0A561T7Z2_9ACTN|nr:M64 family metallopeptidase [Streptomyces capillispiralis]TWF83224.1 IgA peptidase M64 [Streptomyces capillispiralis]GHH94538.1 peptidase [Streptomyces capillispiralis]
MTTSDGSVQGRTQIHGRAPRNRAFTVVLLGDGFTSTQQTDFNTACTNFVTALTTTPPYDKIGRSVNIWRVNVTSTDSGADDPVGAGGTGATARTYFDSTFGANNIRRLLVCDSSTVLQTAAAQVPEFTVAIVVVNSTIYGGSGGSIGTYSLAPGATEIAIHELGHTAYGLADEYACYACTSGETGHDVHPTGEPTEPNVTQNTRRDTLKWGWAVDPGTALPTMSNPNCATVDDRPSTVPAGTVGCFEGAHYYHCAAFRPEHGCKMRTLGVPFCQVCSQVIRARTKVAKNICALTPSRNAVYRYDGSGTSWTKIGGPAGTLYAGGWGLVATNPSSGDLYRYLGTPDSWQLIGSAGAQFAITNDTVYGLTPSKNAVYRYDGSGTSWTKIGGPAGTLYAGGWGLVATNPSSGDLYRYLGTPDSWQLIGSAGAQFAITNDTVYGLTPSKNAVYRYDGSGTSWTKIGGPAGTLYAGDWGRGLLATNPSSGDLYTYLGRPDSWRLTGSAGAQFAVASDTVYGLTPSRNAVYRYEGSGLAWTKVGDAAHSVVAGDI